MSWAGGGFGIINAASLDVEMAGRRLTARKRGDRKGELGYSASNTTGSSMDVFAPLAGEVLLIPLLDCLTTFSIAVPAVLALHALAYLLWRRLFNKRWYAEQSVRRRCSCGPDGSKSRPSVTPSPPPSPPISPPPPAAALSGTQDVHMRGKKAPIAGKSARIAPDTPDGSPAPKPPPQRARNRKPATFRPIPGALVFPSAFFLIGNFLVTGLTSSSAALLAGGGDCGMRCQWPAIVVLFAVGAYLALLGAIAIHFARRFSKTWEPVPPMDNPADVADPLYRLVSNIRVRILGRRERCGKLTARVIGRAQGEFVKDEDSMAEPARTERILVSPFAIFRTHSADAIDVHTLVLLNRGSGPRMYGVLYDYILLLAQLLLAFTQGLGAGISAGSASANAQISLVLTIQWGVMLYILLTVPSADRIENLASGSQFGIEGAVTLLLLVGAPSGKSYAFLLAMGALFLPIVQKVYDAVISQISFCLRHPENFSARACFFAGLSVLLSIPAVVARLLGVNLASSAAVGTELGDTIAAGTEHAADGMEEGAQNLVDIFGDDEFASNLDYLSQVASDVAWSTMQEVRQHAAIRVQATVRGRQTRQHVKLAADPPPAFPTSSATFVGTIAAPTRE